MRIRDEITNGLEFNALTIVDSRHCIKRYRLLCEDSGEWKTWFEGENTEKIKVHRFDRVWGDKVRIVIDTFSALRPLPNSGFIMKQCRWRILNNFRKDALQVFK